MKYIKQLDDSVGDSVTLQGWVANKRTSKGLVFIVLRDGSGFLQCVLEETKIGADAFEKANQLTLESSIRIIGTLVQDERQEGGLELQATELSVYQIAEEYPIAKKEHGVDFLMDKRHLWLRSRRQWAIMRIRNRLMFAVHEFFQKEGFVQMDPPLFTANACEGTTTLFETDFYGQTAYLSQSGQLYGEAMAMAQGKIYAFGPTFRAEKSKTRRHLSEFWMIEPEMAFYDLDMDMDLIESFTKALIKAVLKDCTKEMELLERDTTTLQTAIETTYPRIPYVDAVKIIKGEKAVNGQYSIALLEQELEGLKTQAKEILTDIEEREALLAKGGIKKGVKNFNLNKIAQQKALLKEIEAQIENIPQWIESAKNFVPGEDFGGSDETILTKLFATPVMVYNWPKAIKAFYMKEVEGDPDYVKGVDLLAPEGFGEIIGGAERETDHAKLVDSINKHKLPMESFDWYLDLRKFGTVPHSGFGLGFERFVAWVSGTAHVRETIPFPRLYGRLEP